MQESPSQFRVKTGAEVLIEQHLSELEGKSVGLVMNPTARINDVHVMDTLLALGVNVTALFAPEHGFRGSFSAGEVIDHGVDLQTGLPVHSLYGSTKKPTAEMLTDVDLLLFDMQDVGARFYTYNSTLKYVIEAAAEYDKEVWVLDRPNPAGGKYVAGWVLEKEFESFVGTYPIPVAHGLTLGELALMAVGENWLEVQTPPNLRVITMEGWKRDMIWSETGLPWIPPSPNLPTFTNAYVYLGTCFIEGTTMSEGRGTPNPFLTIGAPDLIVDMEALAALEAKYNISIDTLSFTPVSIPGKSLHPKHEAARLTGISLKPDADFHSPVEFGLELTWALLEMSPSSEYREFITLLSGSEKIYSHSLDWGETFEDFLERRKKYLLYE